MSRENTINEFSTFLDDMRTLANAKINEMSSHTIDGKEVSLDDMTNEDYESLYVAPGFANYIEKIVKSATFNTNVTGTYIDDTLDASETLDSVNNTYN